jgi:ribonuclease HI
MFAMNIPKIIMHTTLDNKFLLRFDGCSKGNPGLAGAGAVLYFNNQEIWSGHKFLGKKTNNQAEYSGLLLGLDYAMNKNIHTLFVEGDSLLVIHQMTGKYKCQSSNLLDLYDQAKHLEKKFEFIQFNHIYRNMNYRADELSNLALNEDS